MQPKRPPQRTMAITGVLMAMRSNFDPFIGPGRLLTAFEIVIIGGLGSFWGCSGVAFCLDWRR